MSIFIRDYRTSLNMNTIFRTNSRICYWTTLTTLIFWIWHTFVVILVRILLNIIQIYRISVWLTGCRSWALHNDIRSMITILCCIWRYSILNTHRWIMLVKNLMLSNDNVIGCLTLFQNLLLLARIIGRMKRMNWSTTLCRKLRPHLRRTKAVVLRALLLSKVLFDLQSLSFSHISLATAQSITRLDARSSFRGFYASTIVWRRSWSILRIFHFHFS